MMPPINVGGNVTSAEPTRTMHMVLMDRADVYWYRVAVVLRKKDITSVGTENTAAVVMALCTQCWPPMALCSAPDT